MVAVVVAGAGAEVVLVRDAMGKWKCEMCVWDVMCDVNEMYDMRCER